MKALFVGSRSAVLDAAWELGLEISSILAVNGSPLQERLARSGVAFTTLRSRPQLIDAVRNTDFDLLISNGCPYILPVSLLRKTGQQFVNVHPSLLPNLKGKHPVNGALLFGQPLGASCHEMDDGIDTGAVIARVHVDVEEGADLGLLYRLAFMAEGDVFRKAHARHFLPGHDELRHLSGGGLYFSRSDDAMRIDFNDPVALTLRRIAAFSVPGQMARFRFRDNVYLVPRASRVVGNYMDEKFSSAWHGTVIFNYDDTLVVKLRDGYLRMSGIDRGRELREGTVLTNG
ncbi:MAG TPA: formyltransferase family protein [Noviherbaspirillum sp.]|uniref:formyltransferase family protein n=1 Tax=Noviherbaspirillum sp. TaxID=1926288 RepID=UPI002B49AECB|nr:formyltransferase family protein [Noviherbaspirillum sp.]HJV84472.1 formyltransferase family protein [Noviherbaspirillum sp.]